MGNRMKARIEGIGTYRLIMELKYLAVKEEVQKQKVSIEHISTNLMIADPLTKGLPPKTFIGHVERMGVMNVT
ncbi:hypothetical protein CASFOL_005395 [Castilleja foliolosa]|uniref:Uncharacterized protein n=1 Tax=Castilleja foliolosa TaxID=1961234 RepID=A0ABD3E4K0_9LAMI